MIFIPYLIKKDFSRIKIVLFVWTLLILVQLAIGVSWDRIAAGYLESQMLLYILTRSVIFLQGLMLIVIVPLIIHEDSIAGNSAFWFTRPFSGKELLRTKAFEILIIILMPLLAELIVLTVYGAGARTLLLATPEILIDKLALVLPFFILASITSKFSNYILIVIILSAALLVAVIATSIISGILTDNSFNAFSRMYEFISSKEQSVQASFEVFGKIFAIISGSAILYNQFVKRNIQKVF